MTRVGSGDEDTDALGSALRVTHYPMCVLLPLLSLILSVGKED